MDKALETPRAAASRPSRSPRRSSGRSARRRMKARYVVGRDARAMMLTRRLLPDHVFDRVARARSASSAAQAGGGYTASHANRLVVAACVCSIPGRALFGESVSPFHESR